jgi:polyphosphate kinase
MFTCDPEIGADATDLFNFLTGYSSKGDYKKLWIAPVNLRSKMEYCIRREISNKAEGKPARMILKMNSLVDKPMITSLYEASQAGVEIDLLVRGICCLRPGILGVSDNIRVISVVGRFLEHSRIYYFMNGGEEEVYMGSADLMPRNLNRRVEVIFPIEDQRLIKYIRDQVLETYLLDNTKARFMTPNGEYNRFEQKEDDQNFNSQQAFIDRRMN